MTEQEIKLAKELALYMVRHGITDTEKGMTAWIDSNKKINRSFNGENEMKEKYINTISGESQTLEDWIYETKLEGYHTWDQQEEEITPEQYVEGLIRNGGLVREDS